MKARVIRASCIFVTVIMLVIVMSACSAAPSETSPAQKTTESTVPTETTVPPTTAPTTAPATEPRPFTDVSPGEIPIDSEGVYASHGEGAGWSSYIYSFGAKNTGKRHISFDVTPLEDGIDASVDFADYDVKTTNFQNLAMMVRFSTAGNIGVQSGASFDSLTEVKYTANMRFHVDIYADMSVKKYTVYITPEGGDEVMVAEDFGFRNSASQYTNDAGKMFIISAEKDALLRVENVTMEAYK